MWSWMAWEVKVQFNMFLIYGVVPVQGNLRTLGYVFVIYRWIIYFYFLFHALIHSPTSHSLTLFCNILHMILRGGYIFYAYIIQWNCVTTLCQWTGYYYYDGLLWIALEPTPTWPIWNEELCNSVAGGRLLMYMNSIPKGRVRGWLVLLSWRSLYTEWWWWTEIHLVPTSQLRP